MNMIHLDNKAPKDVPLLRVYASRCTLNASAAKLLGLMDGGRIDVLQDKDEADRGRDRIYVCCSPKACGYAAKRRGRTFIVHSTSLCRILSAHLQGLGTYRITPDFPSVQGGVTYYNIFFRKENTTDDAY